MLNWAWWLIARQLLFFLRQSDTVWAFFNAMVWSEVASCSLRDTRAEFCLSKQTLIKSQRNDWTIYSRLYRYKEKRTMIPMTANCKERSFLWLGLTSKANEQDISGGRWCFKKNSRLTPAPKINDLWQTLRKFTHDQGSSLWWW